MGNLERTELANNAFHAVCPDAAGEDIDPRPREVNQRVVRHIMQAVIAESPYKPDLDWELWHHCQQLEEQNGLPDGVTAHDIYQEYLRVFEGEG